MATMRVGCRLYNSTAGVLWADGQSGGTQNVRRGRDAGLFILVLGVFSLWTVGLALDYLYIF
jgi:hypothetical protein